MNYTEHEKYMLRCLQLAKKGIGSTRPNPSVGAVVVLDGVIIGEGYTSAYGGAHAEVNAIAAVKDKNLLKKAVLYVSLEPCSHYGKTPPCADLIVTQQMPKVYIGCVDSHSLVAGKGIERLRSAGCSVTVGILESQCREQLKRFFTVQEKNRPYILLKWAQTKDGFIAPLVKDKQKPVWISNVYSQQLAHKWRAEEQAILVGANTVLADNPSLNVRHWKGLNPIRVVLDKNIQLPTEATVFNGQVPTIVIYHQDVDVANTHLYANQSQRKHPLVFLSVDYLKPLAQQICAVLQSQQIQSVMIEGGAKTLQSFIDEGLWDEARVFEGEVSFEKGVEAPILKRSPFEIQKIHSDLLKTYKHD